MKLTRRQMAQMAALGSSTAAALAAGQNQGPLGAGRRQRRLSKEV